MESNRIGLSIINALLAAFIGGVVWLVIAILTDYELGIIAWAIGGLTGYAVVLATKGKINVAHQVIAIIASLLGIVMGKYFILAYYYDDSIANIFNADVLSIFFNNFMEFFGAYDIVFVLLAVITAWQLPIRLASKEQVTNVEEGNQTEVNQNQ